jgi:methylated-DNA-[protein]-cysteine S-methyltransferase
MPALIMNRGNSLLAGLAGSMRRYFMGRRVDFGRLPLDLGHATAFQEAVWRITSTIPYGSVRTYGWLASHLDGRGCARAVGQALARNPVPVVVPCHRVIEESGAHGGFTAGERWKGILLEIEGGEQRLRLRECRARPLTKAAPHHGGLEAE